MSEVGKTKTEIMRRYQQITEHYSNPKHLSDALEADEAKVSIIDGVWIWDVVFKYFPLANRFNLKEHYPIVKKAVKLCVERGVNIAIVPMNGTPSDEEKKWLENGFWWRVQKFPRVGKITKKDARMLQDHRYNVIRGIANGGQKVLISVGYKNEKAKQIFFDGMTAELERKNLLPSPKGKQFRLEKK